MTSLSRPVASTASTNATSSHEFIVVGSMTSSSGNLSLIYSKNEPLYSLPMLLRTTGRSYASMVFANQARLFRSFPIQMVSTPSTISGWWSMSAIGQFWGVST